LEAIPERVTKRRFYHRFIWKISGGFHKNG
jgi:hypothetical protein